ncbi:autotransporter outer membrane beta-barrel domain-containing protein, partial [Avibacterium paragallinarum]
MCFKKSAIALCCALTISQLTMAQGNDNVAIPSGDTDYYNGQFNAWYLNGGNLKLDGTSAPKNWTASVTSYTGNNSVDIKGKQAKWNSFVRLANQSNLTVNLTENALWENATLGTLSGNLTVNVLDGAKLYIWQTSFSRSGEEAFKKIIDSIDYQNSRLFILAAKENEYLISLLGGNGSGDLISKLKQGTATEGEWTQFKNALKNKTSSLFSSSGNKIMLSSTASIINLRNGGILDFNHSNNPNGKNGLVVDKFTSDDGVIILNSDTNDQYFQIATSASGNVLLQDEGQANARGLYGSEPLIYYLGADTPSLTVNDNKPIMEKGLYTYRVKYYSKEELGKEYGGYYYVPVRLSNTAYAANSLSNTSYATMSLYYNQDRPQEFRTNQYNQNSLYFKPIHQSQRLNSSYNTTLRIEDNGFIFGADKLFIKENKKFLIGASILLADSKLKDGLNEGKMQSYGAKVYASQILSNGIFIDAQGWLNFVKKKMDISSFNSEQVFEGKYHTFGTGIESKIGYHYTNATLFIMPYSGVRAYKENSATYNLGRTRIKHKGITYADVHIGSRLGLHIDNKGKSTTFKPYIDVSYRWDIKNSNRIEIDENTLDAHISGSARYIGLGAEFDLAKKQSISTYIGHQKGKNIENVVAQLMFNYV